MRSVCPKPLQFVFFSILLIPFLISGCNPALKPLKKAKAAWEKQEFASLAAMEVSCKPSDKGCNQLHLMKGDACFQLGKLGIDIKKHFACAVNALQTGITQTGDWQMNALNLNRAQTYENLMESLRLWQDTKQGAEAEKITHQLVSTAQTFLQLEPGHLAGIFFLNSGAYTLLRSELLRQNNPAKLCMDLNHILRSLKTFEPKARGTKYAPNFKRLRMDVSTAKTTVSNCP